MGSYRDGNQNSNPADHAGQSQAETRSPDDRRGATRGFSSDDPRRIEIWRGSPQLEDAVNQCSHVGSQGGISCSPGSRRQRPEMSRLPGLFRVRSNSVQQLDSFTLDEDLTLTNQLSRRTVEDAVHIQLSEGSSLRPDLATHLEERTYWAGRPTSFHATPGSSFWGRRQGGHS